MKNVWIVVGCFAAAEIIAAIFIISSKNKLIRLDETVNENWSQIENQLQRRADLIPNLVNTVKGYAKHEEKIFTELAAARSRLLSASGPQQKAEAEAGLNGALGRLLAVTENYPNLKADNSFLRLQDELAGTENRIAVARMNYNKAAKEFNYAIRSFPGSMFAAELELKKREYFEAPKGRQAVEQTPDVKF